MLCYTQIIVEHLSSVTLMGISAAYMPEGERIATRGW